MKQADMQTLCALKASLNGENLTFNGKTDYNAVLQSANLHSALPLVYQAVYKDIQPEELKKKVGAFVREQVAIQIKKNAEGKELYQRFTSVGIRPLVVKGIVCANLYPNPHLRTSLDEDLLILPSEFEDGKRVLSEYGLYEYTEKAENGAYYEVIYNRQDGSFLALFSPENVTFGDFNKFFDGAHERAVGVEIDGQTYYTLCPTDHLLFLILHAFKHFLHAGFGIRQVGDIAIFSKAYANEIDWEKIERSLKEIKAFTFTCAIYKIADKYLGFTMPEVFDVSVDEGALLEDIMDGGVFGLSDSSRLQSGNMMMNAVSADKKGKKGKRNVFKTLFPPYRVMKEKSKYKYLNKCPVLLPWAWMCRLCRYAWRALTRKGGSKPVKSMKLASARIEIMRKYEIID